MLCWSLSWFCYEMWIVSTVTCHQCQLQHSCSHFWSAMQSIILAVRLKKLCLLCCVKMLVMWRNQFSSRCVQLVDKHCPTSHHRSCISRRCMLPLQDLLLVWFLRRLLGLCRRRHMVEQCKLLCCVIVWEDWISRAKDKNK